MRFTFTLLPETFAICDLKKVEKIPEWALKSTFYIIVCAQDEFLVVCPQENVPEGIKCSKGWHCLKLEGTPEFLTFAGILSTITKPLSDAKIPLFASSTYANDYIFFTKDRFQDAIEILSKAGHKVRWE